MIGYHLEKGSEELLRKCIICGKEFETSGSTKTCSDECRHVRLISKKYEWRYSHTDINRRETKTCIVCGKSFLPSKNSIQVTCSEECRKKHRKELQRQRYGGDNWDDWLVKQKERGLEQRTIANEKKARRRQENERKKAIKYLVSVLKKRERKLKNFRTAKCVVCGEEFTTFNPKQVTCSKKCQKRYQHQKNDERYKGITIDKGITLESVYKKDSGTCYLCGCKCNWEDRTIRDDGTFIVGKTYPTIEHVKPISKGGLHEWKNIRLACWQCNTIKRDKIITV